MIIDRITLRNFRSYEYIDVTLKEGLNAIVGPNGSGKTNLAEAIQYLSLGRSFRTSDDKDLIKKDATLAQIDASTRLGSAKNQIRINLSRDSKTVLINSKKINKLSLLSSVMNVIIFKPSDVNLFKSSPSVRRKFLDIAISKQNDIYLENLTNYNKLIKERNELLKAEEIDKLHISVIDEQLSSLALSISRERDRYITSINKVLSVVVNSLSSEKATLEIKYHRFVNLSDTNRKEVLNIYNAYLESDIKSGSTSVGPHREDFETIYNGNDIATYGSQGENRLSAIALILTPYFLITDEDKKPIVILDDVLSELDDTHRDKLLKFMSKFRQCIITATECDYTGCACIYEINKNKITRREP